MVGPSESWGRSREVAEVGIYFKVGHTGFMKGLDAEREKRGGVHFGAEMFDLTTGSAIF